MRIWILEPPNATACNHCMVASLISTMHGPIGSNCHCWAHAPPRCEHHRSSIPLAPTSQLWWNRAWEECREQQQTDSTMLAGSSVRSYLPSGQVTSATSLSGLQPSEPMWGDKEKEFQALLHHCGGPYCNTANMDGSTISKKEFQSQNVLDRDEWMHAYLSFCYKL